MGGQRSQWRRWRSIGVVLAAILTGTTMFAATPGAARAAGQVLWWDDEGTSFATFGANAAVTIAHGEIGVFCDDIFPTANVFVLRGGPSHLPPVDGASLVDVNGTPNTVFGLSGGFFSDTIAFTFPSGNLGPGTYTVVYDECQDGTFNATVDAAFVDSFEVILPADIPPIDPAIEALKTNSGSLANGMRLALDELELYEKYEEFQKAIAVATACATSPSTCALSYAIGQAQAAILDQIKLWLGLTTDPKQAGRDAALDTINHYKAIEADPPDPAFRQAPLVEPNPRIAPLSADPLTIAAVAVGNAHANEGALAEALLHAVERYQGADAAGNGDWALVHARATRAYATLLAAQLADSATHLTNLGAALATDDRDVAGLSGLLVPIEQRIVADGFTPDEERTLLNLGVDVDAIGLRIARGPIGVVDETLLRGRLADLASAATDAIPDLLATAAAMDVIIADIADDPAVAGGFPVADAGGPYTGTRNGTITLDATGSADPDGTIAAFGWDLDDDGLFDDASGETPTATLPIAFDGLIGLRVVDDIGQAALDYARVSSSADGTGPRITSVIPQERQPELAVGEVRPFEVEADDLDGDDVVIRWYLDGESMADGATFEAGPFADSGIGLHHLRAVVTSGGDSIDHDWLPVVLAADADNDGWRANVDCNDAAAAVHPGASEVPGNGRDDDCDPTTSDVVPDRDGDGYDELRDCRDGDALIHPGQPETPDNGYDDDCNAQTPDSIASRSVIAEQSAGWRYLEGPWNVGPGFEATDYDDIAFAAGIGGFGWPGGCGFSTRIATPWTPGTDLLIRRTFDLSTAAGSLRIVGTIDNEAWVYVNGVFVGHSSTGSCAEHTIDVQVPDDLLLDGPNILAVRGRDYGGLTFLDVGVTVVDRTDVTIPLVDAGPDRVVAAGTTVVLAPATFTDAGTGETHGGHVDWGDGTSGFAVIAEMDGSGTVSAGHAYNAPGTYTATVTVTDDDGNAGSDSFTVTVGGTAPPDNRVPSVDAGGPYAVAEGGSVALAGTATDADADSLTYDWDLDGDGTFETSGQNPTFSATALDGPSNRTVRLRVRDGRGGEALAPTVVEIGNVAPTITGLSATDPVDQDQESNVVVVATDPAMASDPLAFSFDCDGDDAFELGPQAAPSAACTMPDAGLRAIGVRVTDGDGGETTGAVSVTVRNRPPVVTATPEHQAAQYSDPIAAIEVRATDSATDQDRLAIVTSWSVDGGSPTAGLPDGLSITPGVSAGTWSLSGRAVLPLGSYLVSLTVSDGRADATAAARIDVTAEDARTSFSGQTFAATASISATTATVLLSATIRDISITDEAAGDSTPGDIRTATVTFVDRDANDAVLCTADLTPTDPDDPTLASAACPWTADLGSLDGRSWTVGIVVGGRYERNSPADDTVITVARPLNAVVSGGGYLLPDRSFGQYASAPGSRLNFGFTVKPGKGKNTPQGHLNIVIRRGASVYQVRSNAMDSLTGSLCRSGPASPTCPSRALFAGKATIRDISDPASVVALEGNATFQVVVIDAGEPGSADTIAITVWTKAGAVAYSSAWSGSRTVETRLAGGNIQVR